MKVRKRDIIALSIVLLVFIIVLISYFILNTKTNNTDNEDSVENEYYQDSDDEDQKDKWSDDDLYDQMDRDNYDAEHSPEYEEWSKYQDELYYNFNTLTFEELEELFDKNDNKSRIVLIGDYPCEACKKTVKNVEKAQKKLKIKLYYHYRDLNVNDHNKTLYYELDSFFKTNLYNIPLIIVIKNGTIVDSLIGYKDYDKVYSFLKNVN